MTIKKIVLSDVDGTIVRGSLILNHACLLHEKGVLDLGELPKLWKNSPKNETLSASLAEKYREEIKGKTVRQLKATEFINELVQNPNNFYTTLDRLVKHKQEGHDVYLISGSPSFLVNRFGRKFGFKTFSSKYFVDEARKFTGQIEGMFTSSAKSLIIEKIKFEKYSEVLAYGDTSSDMPLFEKAHYSVLVDPSPETTVFYEKKVHEIIHK